MFSRLCISHQQSGKCNKGSACALLHLCRQFILGVPCASCEKGENCPRGQKVIGIVSGVVNTWTNKQRLLFVRYCHPQVCAHYNGPEGVTLGRTVIFFMCITSSSSALRILVCAVALMSFPVPTVVDCSCISCSLTLLLMNIGGLLFQSFMRQRKPPNGSANPPTRAIHLRHQTKTNISVRCRQPRPLQNCFLHPASLLHAEQQLIAPTIRTTIMSRRTLDMENVPTRPQTLEQQQQQPRRRRQA